MTYLTQRGRFPPALRAAIDVTFHLFLHLRRESAVNEFRQHGADLGTVHGVVSSGPYPNCSSRVRSLANAAAKRDLTVLEGAPVRRAISSNDNSSSWRSASTTRSGSGNSAAARAIRSANSRRWHNVSAGAA